MLKKLFGRKALHRVSIAGGDTSFEVGRNKTVLESALESGLSFPHDCTVGTCGQCRSRLLSGKVDAITPFGYTLSREELKAGYILACQAVPQSDLVLDVEIAQPANEVKRVSGRIVETRDLTYDIKQVIWGVTQPVHYRAGQYMNVTWSDGPGVRSYSFSAAPEPEGVTHLSTYIRRVPGGAFTERLFGEDMSSIEFEIEAPHGGFWLRDGQGPILLIGGGSGLAPLMSLLEDAANRGVRRDAILLFGGRAERDIYCQEEIAAIASRWSGRFEFRPVLSEIESSGIRFGMVTQEIPSAIAELGGANGLQAYLCGPPGMIDAGLAVLSSANVRLEDIHYDKFTDASNQAA